MGIIEGTIGINGRWYSIRKIATDQLEIGMTIYSIEFYESGSLLTFFGEVSDIGKEGKWVTVDLQGIPHQELNGRSPIYGELYQAIEIEP